MYYFFFKPHYFQLFINIKIYHDHKVNSRMNAAGTVVVAIFVTGLMKLSSPQEITVSTRAVVSFS